jgi:tetratricopeptide (TPR) repeat protein
VPVEDRPGDEPLTNEVQTATAQRRNAALIAGGAVIALVVVAVLATMVPRIRPSPEPTAQPPAPTTMVSIATTAPDPTAIPSPTLVPTVQPVAAGKYMVLVAELEQDGASKRPVTRSIAESLRRTLEVDLPASNVQVRSYPVVVTSDDQAHRVAEQNHAPIVVWGSYTAQQTQVEIQIGAPNALSEGIDRATLERTANVEVRLDDPSQQSIAPQVLVALNVLHVASGDSYGNGRVLELLGRIQVNSPELRGNSIAERLQRFHRLYFNNTVSALKEVHAAIDLDPNNPLLYMFRSAALVRQGTYDEAWQDATTAGRLNSDSSWNQPFQVFGITAFLAGNLDEAFQNYDHIVKFEPNNWLATYMRGLVSYTRRDGQAARADLERSIALQPEANFPYLQLALLDLHEGKLEQAKTQLAVVAKQFPDPNAGNRLLSAFFGDTRNEIGIAPNAFGNLLLGRYLDVIRDTESTLQIQNPSADLFLVRGLAQCARKQYSEAEAAYSSGLSSDPDFTLLYLLRAEARLRQQNQQGALEDLGAVQQSPLAPAFAPYLAQAQAGTLSCESLLAPP